jgi:hypothetical protein
MQATPPLLLCDSSTARHFSEISHAEFPREISRRLTHLAAIPPRTLAQHRFVRISAIAIVPTPTSEFKNSLAVLK